MALKLIKIQDTGEEPEYWKICKVHLNYKSNTVSCDIALFLNDECCEKIPFQMKSIFIKNKTIDDLIRESNILSFLYTKIKLDPFFKDATDA